MRTYISLYLSFVSICTFAQENAQDIDKLFPYKRGEAMFMDQLYGPAIHCHSQFIDRVFSGTEDNYIQYKDDAASMQAISALRLDLSSGENDLIRFIQAKYPDPVTTPAILELGSYYHNKRWYKNVIETYEKIALDQLPEYEMSEASYKLGYAYFVTKDFKKAKETFTLNKDIQNDFFAPTNYYYGLCDYFLGNHTAAIASFERVKHQSLYKSFVPYYLTQIYFAQNDMDKTIEVGEASLKNPELRNRKEIRNTLGQAYFRKQNYEAALPHLELYESQSDKLTEDEFYQLAFTQYQLKKYNEAIKNFSELNLLDSKLGQLANYYLADCYYKSRDLTSARSAFKKVSQMDYEKKMQEEATFNYGKLSAEAGYDREAINTLIKMEKSSPHYKEGQNIIRQLLENTQDYHSALQIFESLPSLSDELKTVYQKVCLKRALQLYNESKKVEAQQIIEKGLKQGTNENTKAQLLFWSALIQHENEAYKLSITTMDKYFESVHKLQDLPEEASPYVAHYTQAYNHLFLNDYKNAEKSFRNALTAFKQSKNIKNKDISDKMWPDAMVRTGDCLFKVGKYKEALSFYDQAIQVKKGSFVYAMYQKAMIEGLLDEPYEKILTLKEIHQKHAQSAYVDDALMQMGDTYFELQNVDNAYASFSELVTKHKNSPLKNAAHLKMGLLAYNKGDMQKAIQNYKDIFQNNPSAKEAESALLGLQEIYVNDLGQSEEYVSFVNGLQGYKLSDHDADSLAYMVGDLRYNNGEYEKAVVGFNTYLEKYPNGANKTNALYYRAESKTLLKKYAEALEDYEKVSNVGQSAFYVKSLKKAALIAYNHTLTFDKALKYYDLYYQHVGEAEEKYQAALGALRSAFRLPAPEMVKKYGNIITENTQASQEEKSMAAYYVGKTYYKESSWEEAMVAFIKASDKINNNQAAESRYLIADILYKLDQKEKAENQCNAANDKNAAYPFWIAKSLMLLSDIYVDRNDLFNARAALEAVTENFPDDKVLLEEANIKLQKVEQLEAQKNRIKPKQSQLIELQNSKGN